MRATWRRTCSIILILPMLCYEIWMVWQMSPPATQDPFAEIVAAVSLFYAMQTVVMYALIAGRSLCNQYLKGPICFCANSPITKEFIIFMNGFPNLCYQSLALLKLMWIASKLKFRGKVFTPSTKLSSAKYSDL